MAIGMNLFLNEHSHLNAPVYFFKFSILQITFNESDTLFLQLNQNVTTNFHWGISTVCGYSNSNHKQFSHAVFLRIVSALE